MKELTVPLRRNGGRNSLGRVVSRGIGGGHKQRLRAVDFYRVEQGVHDVVRIEYDPGRSGHIALLHRRGSGKRTNADEGAILAETESDLQGGTTELRIKRNEVKGGWSYILAPDELRAGDVVQSFRNGVPDGFVEGWTNDEADNDIHSTAVRALGVVRTTTVKPGNVLPLYLIPPGTIVHNLSTTADGRMALCRAAGTFATVVAHHDLEGEALGGPEVLNMGGKVLNNGIRTRKNGNVLVKLQSGEIRKLDPGCIATIGMVSK